MMDNEQVVQEIDLMSLIRILFRRWYIIFGFVILFLVIAFIYAFRMLDDQYQANASMIVLVSNEEQTIEQNFNFSSKLTKTYTELAKSDLVIDRVISELVLDCRAKHISDSITITGVQDTIMIKLSVQANDPVLASDIANKTVEVMQAVSKDFEGFDNIEVLDVASIPLVPSGPNRMLYLAISIILGAIIGVGIIFISEMLDQTIKTTKDIELKLNLRVLATIPEYDIPEANTDEKI
jgi:protein tyrosine kinase modulator